MMNCKNWTLAFALALGGVHQAQATSVGLSADGQWHEFTVDDFSALSQGVEWIDATDTNAPGFGSSMIYRVNIANGYRGTLSLVDGGFAGDYFNVQANGQSLGETRATTNITDYSNNFSANWLNPNFSQGSFSLAAGNYLITGTLGGTLQPFNSTNGAIKLDVSAVPLPGSLSALLAGLGVFAFFRRRRL